jgi:hypothetical protein
MPEFKFDITEKALEYAQGIMDDMPGNAGQESLVNSLDIDAQAIVVVYIAGDRVDVDVEYDIDISSSHPEAIEQIIDKGEQAFEEYAERASDILGLVEVAFDSL